MAVGVSRIADEARVSKSLVSRYLNKDPKLRISRETSSRIEEARIALGIPRPKPRRRHGRRKQLVQNFIVPINCVLGEQWVLQRMTSPLIVNVESIVAKEGFRLSPVLFREESRLEFFESLMRAPALCDGLVLGSRLVDNDLAELIRKNRIPHVCLDREGESYGLSTIRDNSSMGIRQAARHLLELGHARIDYLSDAAHRYPDYVAVMAELGLPITEGFCRIRIPALRPGQGVDVIRNHAREGFERWLDEGRAATAVICHTDTVAFGAIEAMRERGLEPGRDISVVGYGNSEERDGVAGAEPFLTTIDNPTDLIGRRCGEMLLDQVLDGRERNTHEQIPVKLVVRKTTGPSGSRRMSL